jgi:hypothetical protein
MRIDGKERNMKVTRSISISTCCLALFLLFFSLSIFSDERLYASATRLLVEAVPIQLDPEDPSRSRFGLLTFLAGFELRSEDARFGGLSGLAMDRTGRGLLILSDRGRWLSAELKLDPGGSLIGFGTWKMGPLPPLKGRRLGRYDRDAEGIAQVGDDSYIVTFEQNHRAWLYQLSQESFVSPPVQLDMPAELARAPSNGGLEAVTVLPDGKILALTERYKDRDGYLKGWLLGDRGFVRVAYRQAGGFSPTDLATSATGDIFVLERRYDLLRGPAVRILEFPSANLNSGVLADGRELLRLEHPLTVDNFEGLATHEEAQGDEIFYLVSDNNFSLLQRTLLLQFRLRRP